MTNRLFDDRNSTINRCLPPSVCRVAALAALNRRYIRDGAARRCVCVTSAASTAVAALINDGHEGAICSATSFPAPSTRSKR